MNKFDYFVQINEAGRKIKELQNEDAKKDVKKAKKRVKKLRKLRYIMVDYTIGEASQSQFDYAVRVAREELNDDSIPEDLLHYKLYIEADRLEGYIKQYLALVKTN